MVEHDEHAPMVEHARNDEHDEHATSDGPVEHARTLRSCAYERQSMVSGMFRTREHENLGPGIDMGPPVIRTARRETIRLCRTTSTEYATSFYASH